MLGRIKKSSLNVPASEQGTLVNIDPNAYTSKQSNLVLKILLFALKFV
jgi:hypothetical protein